MKNLENKENNLRIRRRLQLLRILKSGLTAYLTEACQMVGYTDKHGRHILAEVSGRRFSQLCQDELFTAKTREVNLRTGSRVNHQAATFGFDSQAAVQNYIFEQFEVRLAKSNVSKLLQRLAVTAKVPRPRNRLTSETEQIEYKKTTPQRLKDKTDYFEDEFRFGTRTALGKRWTAKGVRPVGTMNIGYDYGYLYVAVNPFSGRAFGLILPSMTLDSMKVFIEEFRRWLAEKEVKLKRTRH